MIRIGRARSSAGAHRLGQGDAAPPWLTRSEAFAEDLTDLVATLPQWQRSAARRGFDRRGEGMGAGPHERWPGGGSGAGAGAGLLGWIRRRHWQGA